MTPKIKPLILQGILVDELFIANPIQPGSNFPITSRPTTVKDVRHHDPEYVRWAEIKGDSFIEFANRTCIPSSSLVTPIEWRWAISDIRILTDSEIPNPDSLEWQLDHAIWGTYGKDGTQPLKYILLKDAETSHLEAILESQKQIGNHTRTIIKHILELRSREGTPQKQLEIIEL